MKYFPYIVVGLFFLSSFTTLGIGTEEKISQEMINLSFSMPTIHEHDPYIEVSMEGTNTQLYHAGKPILPIYTMTMKFPFGTKIIDVKYEDLEIKHNVLPKKIIPAPEPIIRGMKNNDLEYKMEKAVYNSDELYPDTWFCYYTGGGLEENNEHKTFFTLRVYPVRYSPNTDTITYVENLNFTINYKYPKENLFPKNSLYDLVIITPLKFSRYLLKLANHKNDFGVRTTIKTLSSIYREYSGVDKPEKIKYFIKDAIETWDAKYVLLVGGLKSILFGRPRDNRNEGTRDWLMPVRYSNIWDNGSIFDPGFISDLYYADIYDSEGNFSSWDSDGDGIFGSWISTPHLSSGNKLPGRFNEDVIDEIDFYPDIYVGRLPCRNKLELKTMVNKIIEYERVPADPSWFKKMIVIGGDPYDDVGTDYIEGELVADKALYYMPDFESIKLYASNKYSNPDYTPVKTNILRELNAGCGFIFFDGHATPAWWNTFWPGNFNNLIENGGITIYDFPKLRNGEKLPICIVGGCHCSQFNVTLLSTIRDKDNSKFMWSYGQPIPECWSWWLTRKIGGGSIATIGSTGLGYEAGGENGDLDGDSINEPDCVEALGGYLESQFFKAYGTQGFDILGETWSNAIKNYLEIFPGMENWSSAKIIEQWVLFGDPSLKIGGYP